MVTFSGLSEEEINHRLNTLLASIYVSGEDVSDETIAVFREVLEGKKSTEEVIAETKAKYSTQI